MIAERWRAIQRDDLELTPEEIAEGWHFCHEYDGLLVGPGMSELDCCRCLDSTHPVYKTVPPVDPNLEAIQL